MTRLTDRFVAAVLRAVPTSKRAELGPEIRALVADAIEAQVAAGEGDATAAERAALTELGDPTLLAARYADRPQYLLGPGVFPEWQRLLTLLLPTVVPIVSLVVLAANFMQDATVGEAITAALETAVGVALQTVFWVTLVFVVIERVSGTNARPTRSWAVDDLPELPDDGRTSLPEAAGSLVTNVAVLVGLLWVQLQPPIRVEGEALPLFDPALWSFWLPWFLAVTVLEILLMVGLIVRRRWSWTFAVANAALGAAFAIPAIYLLQNDLLFNPALVARVVATTGSESWLEVTGIVIACVVATVAIWDAIDGFRKARQAETARRGAALLPHPR